MHSTLHIVRQSPLGDAVGSDYTVGTWIARLQFVNCVRNLQVPSELLVAMCSSSSERTYYEVKETVAWSGCLTGRRREERSRAARNRSIMGRALRSNVPYSTFFELMRA